MSYLSSDVSLSGFAGLAGELRFDDSAKSNFDELQSLKVGYRNCYKALLWWEVRLYIAGKQRSLGRFYFSKEYDATRFADLCIVRFWKYRKTKREITDSDLNYSLALAKHTLTAYPKACQIIDWTESWLQQNYQLQPYLPAGAPLPPAQVRKQFFRTWKKFEALAKQFSLQTAPAPNTRIAFDMLSEHVGQLSAIVRSLESAVPPAPTAKPEAQTAKPETNDVVIGPDGAAQPALHSIDHSVIPPLFSK